MPSALLLQEIGVGLFVVSMMTSVGLDLTLGELVRVFRKPGRLLGGMGVNYLLMPAVAWLVCRGLDLPGPVAAAILLVSAAPGGPVGPVLTRTAGGDLALATAFVVATNVTNTLATPVLAVLLEFAPPGGVGEAPLLGMARAIVIYQLVPLALAIRVRQWNPAFARRARPWVNRFMNGVIGIATIAFLATHAVRTLAIPASAGVGVLMVVCASLVLGWWVLPGSRSDRVTMSMSTGIRSMSVVLLVATAWYPDPRTLVVSMAYSMTMFLASAGVALWVRGRAGSAGRWDRRMSERPSKPAVVRALLRTLRVELAAVENVAAMARDEASSEETRSEGEYDTRATEASYLARGQAWRVEELRRQMAWFATLDPTRSVVPPVVQVGALVEVEGPRREWVLVTPVGGGQVEVEGRTVRVVSPSSPLGAAMCDLEAGDAFEVDTPGGVVEYEVLSVS